MLQVLIGLQRECIVDTADSKRVTDQLQQYADIFNNIQVGLHIYHLQDLNDREGKTLKDG